MSNVQKKTDVILIGAGVMSATLGSLLKELAPEWDIKVFEKLADAGEESSNEWNNAGTGHSALCELNYTSEKADGSIDITKAIRINEQFQLSRQFWSYLVSSKLIRNPQDFIMPIPHMSLVQGEKNVSFLKKRFEALSNNPLFQGMEYSDSPDKLKEWIPLIMKGRTSNEPIAATKIDSGTDVNFGALTRMLFDHLKNKGVQVHYKRSVVHYKRSVKDIKRKSDGMWEVKVADVDSGKVEYHTAKFIFIGGGGGSLPLLQKTGIPESKHIGGFPVSGLFMVCNNPEVIAQHHGKVYGKAKVGAPPMSVPHLDTRYIDNKKTLLFGPFAGFSPKFLKTGSNLDLISSVKPNNILTMLAAGVKEMALTKYLIQQVLLSNLDTRYIDNKKTLLFGPFAGFSPKFLKTGSNLDLISSVKPNNILTMLAAGVKEMALTKYLIQQVLLSNEKRVEELREFIPNAKSEDWDIVVAGQRVQVIKDTEAGGKGTLQFGTEVVSAADGSVAALLGASPGASTAVHVMLEVLEKCFPENMNKWEPKIKEMIPSYGMSLVDHPDFFNEIHASTSQTLGLIKKESVYS